MFSFPWVVQAGSVAISAHVLFEAAAYTAGFALYQRLRARQGDVIADTQRSSVIVAAILGALAGSKLLFLVEDPALTAANWTDPAFLLGGKTIVGGLLGGTIAVEWVKRQMSVGTRTGDLFVFPLIVGMILGRIGCFVSGLEDHTYGVATALPWGIDFGDGLRRHPVQLYEVLFLALLGAALHRMRPLWPNGATFRAFLLSYFTWRIGIDFWKPGAAFAGLTAIQWVSLAAVLWYGRNAPQWFGTRQEAHG